MNNTNTITDFGQKIGGAKKDLWRSRNLTIEDLYNLDDIDRKNFVKKDLIWKKPDYQKMCEEGKDKIILYFIKTIRDAIPATIPYHSTDVAENYIGGIEILRDAAMNISSHSEITSFYKNIIEGNGMVIPMTRWSVSVPDKYKSVINNKLLKAVQTTISTLDRQISKKKFLYTDEEKILSNYTILKYSADNISWEQDYSNRIYFSYKIPYGHMFFYPKGDLANKDLWKENTWFVSSTSRNIIGINYSNEEAAKASILNLNDDKPISTRRPGKKRYSVKKLSTLYRTGRKDETMLPEFLRISGETILNEFNIRGGEFGTWVSDDEKQLNLNWAYLSFVDLADALNIPYQSISIQGRLSIAFGSRGSGNALAHYELDREVINLTRMKGAGSLAHEWGHAIDFISKSILGRNIYDDITFDLLSSFKYHNNERTEFYKNSLEMDRTFSKSGHGYWSSSEELFARAFACYIADKLKSMDRRNDYLHGHSEDAMTIDGDFAVPTGEERVRINEEFDKYFEALKSRGVL